MSGLVRRLRLIGGMALLLILLACGQAGAEEPVKLRVVLDENYPPYVFRDAKGQLQGLLVDQWALWEMKTGVKVNLTATSWNRALQMMNENRADVIDMITENGERQRIYDFSKPYARLDVAIFFHENISGIKDLSSLKGFQVAVRKGDIAEMKLRSGGVNGIVEFDSYEAIIEGVKQGRVMVFVMDKPPALYYLYREGLQNSFKQSQPLYYGEFHRAVRKGDQAMLDLVDRGFAQISRAEYEELEERWYGSSSKSRLEAFFRQYALQTGVLIILSLSLIVAGSVFLRRNGRKKKLELIATLEQLTANDERHRKLLENLTIAVAAFSPDGKLESYNQRYLDLFGISELQAREGKFRGGWFYLLPDGKPILPGQDPLFMAIESRKPVKDYLLGIRRSGEEATAWVNINVFLNQDNRGEVVQAVAALTEVTQLKLAQEALAESEEKFAKIFRYSGDVIGLVRMSDGIFIEINDSFCNQLGYARAEVIGRTALQLRLWQDYEKRQEVIRRHFSGEKVYNYEASWRHKDGNDLVGMLSAEMIAIGGENHSLFVWHDITERKRAEDALRRVNEELENKVEVRTQDLMAMNEELIAVNQEMAQTLESLRRTQVQLLQSEKLATLGSLVAGIAHEINTPVGIGVTAASHLQKLTRDFLRLYEAGGMRRQDLVHFLEDAEEASTIVYTNLERASRLIRSFKQVSADQSSEERRSFKVKQYMDEILLSLLPKLKKTAHRIQLNCPDELTIDGYPGAFSQVITNLVMNSLLHAYLPGQAGVITIDITAEEKEICLRYADDGVGMSPEIVNRIFDPFFTTRRGEGGTGLGMHIIQNIVTQQFGGSISCDSQPGQGTEFKIRFPQQREEKQDEQK